MENERWRTLLYISYANNDIGKLACSKFDILNGGAIDEHLCKMDIWLRREMGLNNYSELCELAKKFRSLKRIYCQRYHEETGLIPGCYSQWTETVTLAKAAGLIDKEG